jgi:hypothetical protein
MSVQRDAIDPVLPSPVATQQLQRVAATYRRSTAGEGID